MSTWPAKSGASRGWRHQLAGRGVPDPARLLLRRSHDLAHAGEGLQQRTPVPPPPDGVIPEDHHFVAALLRPGGQFREQGVCFPHPPRRLIAHGAVPLEIVIQLREITEQDLRAKAGGAHDIAQRPGDPLASPEGGQRPPIVKQVERPPSVGSKPDIEALRKGVAVLDHPAVVFVHRLGRYHQVHLFPEALLPEEHADLRALPAGRGPDPFAAHQCRGLLPEHRLAQLAEVASIGHHAVLLRRRGRAEGGLGDAGEGGEHGLRGLEDEAAPRLAVAFDQVMAQGGNREDQQPAAEARFVPSEPGHSPDVDPDARGHGQLIRGVSSGQGGIASGSQTHPQQDVEEATGSHRRRRQGRPLQRTVVQQNAEAQKPGKGRRSPLRPGQIRAAIHAAANPKPSRPQPSAVAAPMPTCPEGSGR